MPHRGHNKAFVAVAAAMLVYHLLTRQTTYHDPALTTTIAATLNDCNCSP